MPRAAVIVQASLLLRLLKGSAMNCAFVILPRFLGATLKISR
ncbi:MAG TPA: hypothetical protein VEW69_09790 [Alphaproteobacteria bacterium]|nr:hypothetical protein [Alphaproteobacteria bacterium]